MAEPGLGPCAAAVRRFDPDLFATALFAPEPGRARLMTLYAFDIELSRAARPARRAEEGRMIAAMRLQWWRDVLEAAARDGDGAAPAHEVAGPLARLAGAGRLPTAEAAAMIAAHERELGGIESEAAFTAWAEGRFAALTRAAAALLDAPAVVAAEPAGRARGAAFALRTAAAMATEGRCLLPEIGAQARAALARGAPDGESVEAVRARAEAGLAALAEARGAGAPRAALPAFLPLWQAERVLRRLATRPDAIAAPPGAAPARRSLALGWRALTGRW